MGKTLSLILVLLLQLLATPFALSKTTMDVEPGYDGRFRAGRWSPVFIEVQSDQPRTAIVELRVPNASSSAMTLRQAIGVGTTPQKYVLYAPLAMFYDPLRATLTDADTGKLIAEWPARDRNEMDRGGEQIGFMVVTAGKSPMMQGFRRSGPGSTIVSHQRYPLLPITPIGYDAADVVALNNPEWSRLSTDQQLALIAWARAGGTILLYPGAEIVPPEAPLAHFLPADLGPSTVKTLTKDQLQRLRLPERFSSIGVRTLTPRPGAKAIPMPQNLPDMVVGKIGLGQIVVLPIDTSTLQFNDNAMLQQFWNDTVSALLGEPPRAENNYGYFSADGAAAQTALDRIGDIPNTGSFGFSYIALVIGAMMLIVGPIDWLVLKKLGLQPWTWVTTIGWIGVVTCAALYAGQLLRSGDLHFRTLRVIEQAQGRLVAMDDVALVYAPRSATYQVTSDPTAWWQPVPSGNLYQGSSIAIPMRMEQTYKGNTPDAMWIDVWNWRFLHGRRAVDQAGLVEAKLKILGDQIVGKIANRSDKPLLNIELQSKSGIATVPGTIAPGESADVNVVVYKAAAPDNDDSQAMMRRLERSGNIVDSSYLTLFSISAARRTAADRLMNTGNIILYATIESPSTDVAITNPNAITQHTAMLRAVIEPSP